MALTGRIGSTDRNTVGNNSLWNSPLPNQFLQVSWESSLSSGQKLDSSCPQPVESTKEVETADLGDEHGGYECPYLGSDLCVSGSVVHASRVGYVGHDNVHWESFGWIPPQGGLQSDRGATLERTGRSMGLSPCWRMR